MDPNHVVIFGALRSGSTLLRLILDAHPALHCPGEIDFLFDHIKPDTEAGKWVLDIESLKLDRIFRDSGLICPSTNDALEAVDDLIAQMRRRDPRSLIIMIHRNLHIAIATLGPAKFVHLIRDPRDVAASSIGMGWAGNVYYGVDHWIGTETNWHAHSAVLSPASIFTLFFEELIADVEPTLAKLCAFFGTEFKPAMLEYHLSTTYDPIDPKLASQWRSKRSEKEIRLIESRVGSMLQQTGYKSSGLPSLSLGVAEKAYLWLQNKVITWKIRIERYGFLDSLLVAVARHLAMPHFSAGAQLRINEREKQFLK